MDWITFHNHRGCIRRWAFAFLWSSNRIGLPAKSDRQQSQNVEEGAGRGAMSAMLISLLASTAVIAPAHCEHVPLRKIERLKDLPKGALEAVGERMADRGQRFQATDVILVPGLPNKRFVSAEQDGCALTIVYEQGGFAHRWVTISLRWSNRRWEQVSRR